MEKRIKQEPAKEPVSFPLQKAYLTATVTTQEQYDVCKACGIKTFTSTISFAEIKMCMKIGKANCSWVDTAVFSAIGRSNPFVTDYSLNVVNGKLLCVDINWVRRE